MKNQQMVSDLDVGVIEEMEKRQRAQRRASDKELMRLLVERDRLTKTMALRVLLDLKRKVKAANFGPVIQDGRYMLMCPAARVMSQRAIAREQRVKPEVIGSGNGMRSRMVRVLVDGLPVPARKKEAKLYAVKCEQIADAVKALTFAQVAAWMTAYEKTTAKAIKATLKDAGLPVNVSVWGKGAR